MVYMLFYRVDNGDNAERFTGVLTISLITVFVLLLLTSGLLTLLVWHLKKKKTYRSRGSRYSVKGNTKFQTSYVS